MLMRMSGKNLSLRVLRMSWVQRSNMLLVMVTSTSVLEILFLI